MRIFASFQSRRRISSVNVLVGTLLWHNDDGRLLLNRSREDGDDRKEEEEHATDDGDMDNEDNDDSMGRRSSSPSWSLVFPARLKSASSLPAGISTAPKVDESIITSKGRPPVVLSVLFSGFFILKRRDG